MDDIENKSQMISALWKELQAVQYELEKIEFKESTVEQKLRLSQE